MTKKRNLDNDAGSEELQKCYPTCCILHGSDIQHLDFTPLSKVQGSVTKSIRIPESTAGVDLEVVVNHRGCYQSFIKNLDCLNCSVASNEASTLYSTRKTQSSSMHLFPPVCIFCGSWK